jgi:hypothetical protein
MEAVAYDAPAAPGGDDYLTASSGSLPAVDAAIEEQMGAGEPLDREEEYRFISNGWEKPDK